VKIDPKLAEVIISAPYGGGIASIGPDPDELSGLLDGFVADPEYPSHIELRVDLPDDHGEISGLMTGMNNTVATDLALHVTSSTESSTNG
jgi:hypothetical protein